MSIQIPPSFTLKSFESIDSTNNEAKRQAQLGAKSFTVYWAETQTQGRGRKNRTWVSEKGNLFVTVLLRDIKPMSELSQLSIVGAVAIGECLVALCPNIPDIKYKWPNDILINGKKAVGLLLEAGIDNGSQWAILGTGVNLNSHPENVMYPATDIGSSGVEVNTELVLEAYLASLDKWLSVWIESGIEPIIQQWRKRMGGLGQKISVQLSDDTRIEGTFSELSEDGTLILTLEDGSTRPIVAGDVFL